MKALAQLGTGAHIAIAIVFTAMFSGRAAYTTLYPSAPISVWEQEDIVLSPVCVGRGRYVPGHCRGAGDFRRNSAGSEKRMAAKFQIEPLPGLSRRATQHGTPSSRPFSRQPAAITAAATRRHAGVSI